MRMTIDIDDERLKDIIKYTGIEKKSPAVAEALACYCREVKRKKMLEKVLSGKTDYKLSNDELEAMTPYDSN